MPTIVSLVAAGLGIAIVPESLRNLGRRGVVYRPLADSGAVVETGICWRVDESAAVCLRFVEFVTAAMPVPAREPRRARVRGAASARVSE